MRRLLPALVLLAATGLASAEEAPVWLVLGPDGRPVRQVLVGPLLDHPGLGPTLDGQVEARVVDLERGRLPAEALGPRPVALFLPASGALRIDPARGPRAVRLLPGLELPGRLVHEGGDPVAGRRVLAARPVGGALAHAARTDDAGRFVLAHLEPGAWDLWLERPDGRLQPLGTHEAGLAVPDLDLGAVGDLSGRVLDAEQSGGLPVPGLRLAFVPLPRGAPGRPSRREATTDAEGRFVVLGLEAGTYEVEVVGTAWTLRPDPPRVAPAADTALELRPFFAWRRRAVLGRVLDDEERPVEGARVRLLEDDAAERASDEAPPAPVATGADGRFAVGGLRPGTRWRLLAEADGRAPRLLDAFDLPAGGDLDLEPVRLDRGWPLEVVVRGPDGARLPGARVSATPAGKAAAGAVVLAAFRREGTTGEDGRVVLTGLAPEDVRVRVEAEGRQGVDLVVALAASADGTRIDVDVAAALRLAGRVLPAGAALPPDLRVRLVPRDGTAPRETPVGEGGAFLFPAVSAGPTDVLVVRASAPDAPLLRYERLQPDGETFLELSLPGEGGITGRVEGVRVGGPPVLVALEAPVLDEDGERWRWRTQGAVRLEPTADVLRFDLGALPPGAYALRAVQGDVDGGEVPVTVAEGEVVDVETLLPEGASVAGIVLDPDAAPVAGATVRLVRLRDDGDAPGRPGGPPEMATALDGSFALAGVAPGAWRLEVEDEDAAPVTRVLRLAEGESLVLDALVLGAGGAVAGRLTDGAGRALDGAAIAVEPLDDGPGARATSTGSDGTFRVEDLRPGRWRVRARGPVSGRAGLDALVEVIAGETTEVRLDDGGRSRVEGTVRRRGEPVAGITVRLLHLPDEEDVAARSFELLTTAEGTFAWDGLPPGRFLVDVVDGLVESSSEIRLRDGDRRILDLEVHEGRIEGRVVDVRGRPVPGAVLTARPTGVASPSAVGRGRTGPQGTFALAGLPVGRWDLEVETPGRAPAVLRAVEAELAGAGEPVEIVVGAGGNLLVEVRGPDGRGVAGAQVWIEGPDGEPLHGRPFTTGAAGRLRIEGVPAGPMRVAVRAGGLGRPPRRRVEVPDGGDAEVAFRLRRGATLRVDVEGAGLDVVPRTRVDLVWAESGEPVERWRPIVRRRDAVTWSWAPRQGVLVITDLAPGRYRLHVEAEPTYDPVDLEIEVAEGEDVGAEVVLPRRGGR